MAIDSVGLCLLQGYISEQPDWNHSHRDWDADIFDRAVSEFFPSCHLLEGVFTVVLLGGRLFTVGGLIRTP